MFVGRSTGFTPVAGAGVPQRLYQFEVDQEVKGDLGRTVDVRIPVKPENGGQVDPRGHRRRHPDEPGRTASWFTTRCGITDPGAVLAERRQAEGQRDQAR